MDQNQQIGADELLARMADEIRDADRVSIIARSVPALVADLSPFDRYACAAVIGGLMTDPAYHANHIRLEALNHLALSHAHGTLTPSVNDFNRWLNDQLGGAPIARFEDPVEDVFITNIATQNGNRGIFTGIWETPDFWVQQVLDVLSRAPALPQFNRIRAEIDAVLKLSEAVAQRAGLSRYITSDSEPWGRIELGDTRRLQELAGRVTFSHAELDRLNIPVGDLQPFFLQSEDVLGINGQHIGESTAQVRPLLRHGNDVLLHMPTGIATAVRMHALQALSTTNSLKRVSAELARQQFDQVFNRMLRFAQQGPQEMLSASSIDPKRMSDGAVQFDTGRYVHLVLLHDDCEEVLREGITSFKEPPQKFLEKFNTYLYAVATQFSAKPDYISGITVIVTGGLGRGFRLLHPHLPDHWHFTVWSLADLVGLAWLEEEWLLKLWKLMDHVEKVKAAGLRVESTVGDSNLYGAWRAQDYRLVPREYPLSAGGSIEVAPGHVVVFRRAARQSFDMHAAYRPDEQRWIAVQKTVARAFFRELEALPMYASIEDAEATRLRGVIETSQRSWWLDCTPRLEDNDARHLQYLIWDAMMNWLARLAPILESRLTLPPKNPIIALDVTEVPASMNGTTIGDQGNATELSVNEDIIRIRLLPKLITLLRQPENVGESAVLKAIVEGVATWADSHPAGFESSEVIAELTHSSDARFIHLFPAQDIRDQLLAGESTHPRYVQMSDVHISELGWGPRVRGSVNEQFLTIDGKERCIKFLNRAADLLWDDIRQQLEQLNRRSVVEACLRNHEYLAADRSLWRRTSRALAAVYADRSDVLRAFREQEGRVSRATLACRIVAEMALSTSLVQGGMQVGNGELDALCGTVLALIGAAYDSDAIHGELVEPRIGVWPNGEVGLPVAFVESIIEPYQSGYFANRFEEHAKDYLKLYSERRQGKPVEEVVEPEFIAAFEAEYGLPLQSLVYTADALEDYAAKAHELVVATTVAKLKETISAAGLTPDHVNSFVQNFTSQPRQSWDTTPAGFSPKDWYPWRFGRKLSLLARPVLFLGTDDDSAALYAPGLVHDGSALLVGNAHLGRFETEYFSSPEMRSWIGSVNDRAGHQFNDRVAARLQALGIAARSSVQMTEFGASRDFADLGDIDVLAWDSASGTVYSVECKNLHFARTAGEIADQLNRFRGEAGDELAKHLRRSDWLRSHTGTVARVTGLAANSITIRPMLVTNTIVPMQFKSGLPIASEDIVPFGNLTAAFTSSTY